MFIKTMVTTCHQSWFPECGFISILLYGSIAYDHNVLFILSLYVVVLESCRLPCSCCHCLFLLTVCKWSCLRNADCLAHAVTACSFSQGVSGLAWEMQAVLLMLSLLVLSAACMWSNLRIGARTFDLITAFFPECMLLCLMSVHLADHYS